MSVASRKNKIKYGMAIFHKTVQATSDRVMIVNEMMRTSFGSTIPLISLFGFIVGWEFSFSILKL